MEMRPACISCKKELADFGAILLGPQDKHEKVEVNEIFLSNYGKIRDSILEETIRKD